MDPKTFTQALRMYLKRDKCRTDWGFWWAACACAHAAEPGPLPPHAACRPRDSEPPTFYPRDRRSVRFRVAGLSMGGAHSDAGLPDSRCRGPTRRSAANQSPNFESANLNLLLSFPPSLSLSLSLPLPLSSSPPPPRPLSLSRSLSLSEYLSLSLSLYLYLYLYLSLYLSLPLYLSLYLSYYIYTYIYLFLSFYRSIFLSRLKLRRTRSFCLAWALNPGILSHDCHVAAPMRDSVQGRPVRKTGPWAGQLPAPAAPRASRLPMAVEGDESRPQRTSHARRGRQGPARSSSRLSCRSRPRRPSRAAGAKQQQPAARPARVRRGWRGQAAAAPPVPPTTVEDDDCRQQRHARRS